MAHNIAFINGKHAAVYGSNKPAWHHLGEVVEGALTWEEAMRKASLTWNVEKSALLSPYTGKPLQTYGIFRDGDTPGDKVFLGSVGEQYTPLQNKFAFDFVDAILEAESSAHYEAAGALGNGEKIWCLAKINGQTRIDGTNDISEHYLLFTTSHDGSLAATCKLTTVRVVCNNTLTQALNAKGDFVRVKHTTNAKDRLEAAKNLVQGAAQNIQGIAQKFNELARRKVTKETFDNVMKRVFGDYENSARIKNQVLEVANLFDSNDGNAIPQIKGSAYNLLNAITEYTDHKASFRKTDRREGMADNAIRAENALFGNAASLKEKALDVIIEATSSAPAMEARTVYMPITPPPAPIGGILDEVILNTIQ
jgi:phage/plasmid-like protein (TIGR03299 family)